MTEGGITAVFLQLIDASIVTIARSNGWPPSRFRLPATWFEAVIPDSDSRYGGGRFWGGTKLHRVS
ncbi:hypothetical protein ABIE67_005225 [Streptomyces sp. V4I8]